MFVLAYAFLVTYQAYYLLDKIGSAEADVPHQIFLGTLVQSVVLVAASLVGGRLSDRTGRRKVFVLSASIVYGLAMFVIAIASGFNGFLVGMAISGLGFGMYMAVDLALVADVLPDQDSIGKDLGVFNIAGALPFAIAPAIAPVILAVGGGSYGVLYAVAGVCAIAAAFAILPVRACDEQPDGSLAGTNGPGRGGGAGRACRAWLRVRTGRDVDVVIIGSGFGGSVAALRLSEKGYRVAVLEMGRRFTPDTLPRTSWDVRRFLWAPRLGLLRHATDPCAQGRRGARGYRRRWRFTGLREHSVRAHAGVLRRSAVGAHHRLA